MYIQSMVWVNLSRSFTYTNFNTHQITGGQSEMPEKELAGMV
jgi:hypothetical protein